MKKNFYIKMLPMLVMVVTTIVLSIGGYAGMTERERERCWERLELATNSTASKVQVRINDNVNFLKAVSDSYILSHNINDTAEVGKYLNSVMEMTIFERIDVILPDNTMITQEGTIVERGGTQNYEQLLAKGTHISGRVTSSFTGREVICAVTPIMGESGALGLLVGTMDCGTLSQLFEVFTYGGDAQLYLIDCSDGKYIIDNWHEELGNVYELGERIGLDGKEISMSTAIMNRERVRFAYYSRTNGEKSYQYCVPVDSYNWELCVVVQEETAFNYLFELRDILVTVATIEIALILVYVLWNIFLTMSVSKSEEAAKHLEFERVKNEARSKFISNMSHDIKTPLNGIVGMLEIINNHRDDEKKVDDCLRKIAVSTEYLSTLASDMLDISEIENDKLVLQEDSIHIHRLATDIDVILKKRAEDAGVVYHIDVSQVQHPNIIGSSVHLKRVLINLIGNAIKYSKNAGKTIWITMKDEEIPEDSTRRLYHFIIKDNGIGMTKEFQKNMYTAFEQENIGARSDYQGYGLGLTIVNSLVKKMDGKIELESEKNVGSTFTVSVPFRLNAKEKTEFLPQDVSVDLSGMSILIVEDNELNMEVAETILADAGARVSKAMDGEAAIEVFKASGMKEFDLILMDIMMPILDGCEATKGIRALDREDAKRIPILAMSANTFAEEIKRCEEAGMNGYIAKPIDVRKLMIEAMKYNNDVGSVRS